MATRTCPNCGRENPEELEVCQFCQAALRPLPEPPALSRQGGGENETEAAEGDLPLHPAEFPDWLKDLRKLEEDQEPESGLSPELGPPDEQAFTPGPAPHGGSSSDWILESEAEAVPGAEAGPPQAAIELQPPAEPEASPVKAEPEIGAGPQPEAYPGSSAEPDASPDQPGPAPSQAPEGPGKSGFADVPATASSQPAEPFEIAGPLAGLHGLLSAEGAVPRSHYPTTRPSKLRISANQLIHIDLLREMLDEEGKAQPTPSRRLISSEHLVRWGIALVLLLAVLWSVLYPGQPASLPLFQEETAELNRLIEQLPEGAPVLVAFDYQPALSAEMDNAAYSVLDHLMLKGASLTLISTSATGPILAERFMQRLWPTHHYTADQQYTNLGYVPGGPAGLASLARNLPATLPYTISGLFAWESSEGPAKPPLANIRAISDYPLILVLVDDVDTARAWVEQLQPYLSGPTAETGLTMVTSAQVEPIVWPYFDANPRQVHGFLSGLRGGASYARLSGREDLAPGYWNSFGMGLFIAALLILVGGLFYVTYPMLTKPPKPDSEAAP